MQSSFKVLKNACNANKWLLDTTRALFEITAAGPVVNLITVKFERVKVELRNYTSSL